LTAWIFFIFRPSKIRDSPTGVVFSLSPPQCHLSSSHHHHAAALCHASLPWSQDELAASTSSFGNASSRHLLSRAETEALNSHHRHRPPSSDHLTPTLHCYKKVISTLTTLPTTQPRLHFTSSKPVHHAIGAPPTVVVLFHRRPMPIIPPYNDTYGDKLVDPLSLLE
jgi:hypothetical protein